MVKYTVSALAALAASFTRGVSAQQTDPDIYNSTGFDLLKPTTKGARIVDGTTGVLAGTTAITAPDSDGDGDGERAIVVAPSSKLVSLNKDSSATGGNEIGEALFLENGGAAATLCAGSFTGGSLGYGLNARPGSRLQIAGGSYAPGGNFVTAALLVGSDAVITGGLFESQGGDALDLDTGGSSSSTSILGGTFSGSSSLVTSGSTGSVNVEISGGLWNGIWVLATDTASATINVYGSNLTRVVDQITGSLCDGKLLNVSIADLSGGNGNVNLLNQGFNFTDCPETPTFPECTTSCNQAALATGSVECCGATLYDTADEACCGSSIYNVTKQACCNTAVYDIANEGCCDTAVYDNSTKVCCGGDVKNGTSCRTECPETEPPTATSAPATNAPATNAPATKAPATNAPTPKPNNAPTPKPSVVHKPVGTKAPKGAKSGKPGTSIKSAKSTYWKESE